MSIPATDHHWPRRRLPACPSRAESALPRVRAPPELAAAPTRSVAPGSRGTLALRLAADRGSRRTTLDDIGDIDLLSVRTDRLNDLVEQFAGCAHEWLALSILVGSWPLSDQHQIGIRIATAENHILAGLAQLAVAAPLRTRGQLPKLLATCIAGQRLVRRCRFLGCCHAVRNRRSRLGQRRRSCL